MSEYILYRHRDISDIKQLDVYRKNSGFEAFEKAVKNMEPAALINEVKASGLRGRGGAGFPTGVKWSFLPNNLWPHYVVANADESEPGTFKDREILESNPYQFLEGLMLAAFAVQANDAYIYLRGEFWQIARQLDECIASLYSASLLGDNLFGGKYSLRLHTHIGAGAYICGKKPLCSSLSKAPRAASFAAAFPAIFGLFGKRPLSTMWKLSPIYLPSSTAERIGFKTLGTEKSPGVKIFSLSGCVNKPGNYELPLGTTFRELIFNYGGGIPEGRTIKAIMSAGASSVIVPADDKALDTPMDYESTQTILNAPLGSASVIILDDSVNMAWLVNKTVLFFRHESCGKCTPCREGTYWMSHLTRRL